MSRLRMGYKPGYGPVLKVMRNNSLDPYTTPNTNYGDFRFNSETAELGYIEDIQSGSSANLSPTINDIGIRPMVVGQERYGNWRSQQRYEFFDGYSGGYRVTCGHEIYYSNTAANFGFHSNPQPDSRQTALFGVPSTNDPLPFQSQSPSSGQRVLRLSNDTARMARRGYTVATSNPNRLIFSEDRRVPQVIKAGSMNVPGSGNNSTSLPSGTSNDAVVWYTFTDSAGNYRVPYWGSGVVSEDIRVEYRIQGGDTLTFRNLGSSSVRVHYAVLAEDGSVQTSGSGRVLRQLTTDGEDHVQIIRPGAGANPNFSDIILDTRYSYLPLIADGWVAQGQFSTMTLSQLNEVNLAAFSDDPPDKFDVTLPDTNDYHPVAMAAVVGLGGDGFNATSNFFRFFMAPDLKPRMTYHSCLLDITGNRLRIVTNRNGPDDYDSEGFVYPPSAWRFSGVRWYVFGVPK